MSDLLSLGFDHVDLDDSDLLFKAEGGEDDNFYEAFESLLADEDSAPSIDTAAAGTAGKTTAKKRTAASRVSKKRKLNPDAANIATCTEAALKELEIDPESEDAKKMRRQIRNRLSAQFHRDRKNMYIKELEDRVGEKDKEIQALKLELLKLKEENERLRMNSHRERASSYLGHTDSEGSSATHTPEHFPSSVLSFAPFAESPLGTLATSSAASASSNASVSSTAATAPLGYPRIMSAPFMKSLSVLSVICLLCLSGMAPHGVLVGDGSRVVTRESVLDSGIVEELLAMKGRALPPGRRLLEVADLEQPVELNQSLSAKLFVPNTTTTATTSAAETPAKFHLRRSVEEEEKMVSLVSNGSLSERPALSRRIFVSRHNNLLVDGLAAHSHGHWFPANHLEAQSFSHIVLSQGFALFDPSLQLSSDAPLAAPRAPPHQLSLVRTRGVESTHTSKMSALPPSVTHRGLIAVPQADAADDSSAMDVEDERDAVRGKSIMPLHHGNTWPVVGTPSCETERQAALSGFLSNANLVTVTLPASSVRTGKSLSDSKGNTVESIVRMFNLTALDDDAMTMDHEAMSNASVEISCILLGAKLVVGSPSPNLSK